jgi:hypothetical protein
VRTGSVDGDVAEDVCGVVVLDDAVAWELAIVVSFADWEYAGVDMLHRSR